jgi:hypothetical protein
MECTLESLVATIKSLSDSEQNRDASNKSLIGNILRERVSVESVISYIVCIN